MQKLYLGKYRSLSKYANIAWIYEQLSTLNAEWYWGKLRRIAIFFEKMTK